MDAEYLTQTVTAMLHDRNKFNIDITQVISRAVNTHIKQESSEKCPICSGHTSWRALQEYKRIPLPVCYWHPPCIIGWSVALSASMRAQDAPMRVSPLRSTANSRITRKRITNHLRLPPASVDKKSSRKLSNLFI